MRKFLWAQVRKGKPVGNDILVKIGVRLGRSRRAIMTRLVQLVKEEQKEKQMKKMKRTVTRSQHQQLNLTAGSEEKEDTEGRLHFTEQSIPWQHLVDAIEGSKRGSRSRKSASDDSQEQPHSPSSASSGTRKRKSTDKSPVLDRDDDIEDDELDHIQVDEETAKRFKVDKFDSDDEGQSEDEEFSLTPPATSTRNTSKV